MTGRLSEHAHTFAARFAAQPRYVRSFLTWLGLFALVVIAKRSAISLPASSDESWAVLPAGLWLGDNNLNVVALTRQDRWYDFGPSSYDTSPVTWLTGIVAFSAGKYFLPVLHLAHMAIGAIGLREVFRFARPAWGPAASSLLVFLTALTPVMNGQLGAVYLEVPVFTAGLLTINAGLRGDWRAASVWGFLATLIKPTGIVPLVAILAAQYLTRNRTVTLRQAIQVTLPAIFAGLLPVILRVQDGALVEHRSTFYILYSGYTSLILTLEVFAVLVIAGGLALTTPTHSTSHQNRVRLRLTFWIVIGLWGMFATTVLLVVKLPFLPRYTIMIVPFVIFSAGHLMKEKFGFRILTVATAALIVLMGFNQGGRLHGAYGGTNGVSLESSNAYADVIHLSNIVIDEALLATTGPVYLEKNQWFRTQYPKLGYVDEATERALPMESLSSIIDQDLPPTFVLVTLDEQASTRPLREALDAMPELDREEVTLHFGTISSGYTIYTVKETP